MSSRENKKPVLVVMAAGMGSRYGGLKQIEPMDEGGHIIMDFSLYDAVKAGFEKVIFVIKEENEQIFRDTVGVRAAGRIDVAYAFQKLDDLPEGYTVPEGRVKPWGTGHAVLAARQLIDGPFAVINADDFYGSEAFSLIYQYLTTHQDDELYRFAMISYVLENTLTENGSVARGVCSVDENGYLQDIVERTKIIKTPEGAAYSEDNGQTWIPVSPKSPVSMNFWGFSSGYMKELEERFVTFLDTALAENPQKAEFYLPFAVNDLLQAGKASVQVLGTTQKWYGVTYKEDRPVVMTAVKEMEEKGLYQF